MLHNSENSSDAEKSTIIGENDATFVLVLRGCFDVLPAELLGCRLSGAM